MGCYEKALSERRRLFNLFVFVTIYQTLPSPKDMLHIQQQFKEGLYIACF